MSASRLDRRINIQLAPEPTPDAEGQPVLVHADFWQPFAMRRGLTSREAMQSQQPVALEEFTYIVREDEKTRLVTADEAWRIVEGNKTYDIVNACDLAEIDSKELPRRWLALRVRGRAEVAA